MSGTAVHLPPGFLSEAAGWAVAGALLGFAHFGSLRYNVHCIAGGRALLSAGLQVLRFAFTGAALTFVAARVGAMPLLAATVGIILARGALLLAEPTR